MFKILYIRSIMINIIVQMNKFIFDTNRNPVQSNNVPRWIVLSRVNFGPIQDHR